MPALLKFPKASINNPVAKFEEVTKGLLSDDIFMGEGIGPIGNKSFFFSHVIQTRSDFSLRPKKRQFESAAKIADHIQDDSSLIQFDAYLYGKRGQRDRVYLGLLETQAETRRQPAAFAISEPFQVFDFVVMENVSVRTDPQIRYGPRGKARYIASITIRPISILGAEKSENPTRPVNSGSNAAASAQSVTP
ncbi:MAG: hypothetical protein ABEL51_05725 [Salinibacter sp.]